MKEQMPVQSTYCQQRMKVLVPPTYCYHEGVRCLCYPLTATMKEQMPAPPTQCLAPNAIVKEQMPVPLISRYPINATHPMPSQEHTPVSPT
eukprot:872398-Pelagomonas_calceolata.AAC.7